MATPLDGSRARRCRLPSGERVDEDPRRIDAIVMILEDVLYDHTNMLAHFAIERAIHQLIRERAFPNTVAAYEALQAFRHAYGYRKRFPRFVDSLMAQEKLSHEGAQRVISAYYESQINEARTIKPFEQARATLHTLRDVHGYRLGLVCVGKEDVQRERLRTLGLEEFFGELVFVPSNPTVAQLAHAMKEIGRRFMLQPSSMLFVGRKVFYEIKAANKVGLVTVRMLHGKYTSLMPIEEIEQPDYQIASIDQLVAVVRLADQQLIKPKIVALGGGTGLAVLLKELRHYPADLTAIVTVFDSGRHSGALRKYLGILPPGDIRNCLVALSDSGT